MSDRLEMLREDPPRVAELDEVEMAVKRILGNGVYVHEMDFYEDFVVAYLGLVTPRVTSPWPSQREVSFLNYAPIGAAIARADGDGWALDLPDRDDLQAAGDRRVEYENEIRAELVPAMNNLLEEREEMHSEEAGEYGYHDIDESLDELDLDDTEWFDLGRAVGMMKMASLAHRVLHRRLDAPIEGQRRWTSPAYSVVRERRTESLPPALPDHGESNT